MSNKYRIICGGIVCAVLMGAVCSFAAESKVTVVKMKTVGIAASDDVENAVLERVTKFVKGELNFEISVRSLSKGFAKQTLENQTKELKKLLKPTDVCVVALVKEPGATLKQTVFTVTNIPPSVGIVNLNAINAAGEGQEKTDALKELILRVVEKETMRVVGTTIGLSPCLNPQCAMSPYDVRPLSGLTGRNYCPPCQGEVEKRYPLESTSVRPMAGTNAASATK
jgi:predicted Zn-dependent protease